MRTLAPRRRAALLAAAILVIACAGCVGGSRNQASPAAATPAYSDVSDRLYFGRNIPGGGEVSEAEWDAFLRDVVTPAFPEGLTVFSTRGQWRGESGAIEREAGFVLEVVHAPDPQLDAKLERVAAEYKRRFRQEAVMRVTTRAGLKFYER